MNLIKRDKQKTIESDTCGLLLEVLNSKDFPFGIVMSEDIQSTEAHYHKKIRKCYWVLEGWVDVSVENLETKKKEKLRLEEGDLITFEPFEKHQVTKCSKKNKMVTVTSPAWYIDDVVKD